MSTMVRPGHGWAAGPNLTRRGSIRKMEEFPLFMDFDGAMIFEQMNYGQQPARVQAGRDFYDVSSMVKPKMN